MTTTTIKPNGTVGSANATASTGTIHGCLSDGSDSTYVDVGDATHNGYVQLSMGTFTLPARSVIVSSTNNFRAKRVTGSGLAQMYRQGSIYGTPTTVNYVAAGDYPNTFSDYAGAQPSTQADVDGYELYASILAGDTLRLYDLSTDIKFVPPPTAAVTAPSGSVTTTTTPTVTWTHTPGSDAPTGQTKYRVKVFTAAQYGAGGFDPATSTPDYDSGILTGAATSLVVASLTNSTTYRAYVQTAQTTLGVDQWSDWAYSGFSISVTPANILSVVGTADSTNGRNQVVVTRVTSGSPPMWAILEVQASYDGGTTWQYVRDGATTYVAFVPSSGSPVTLYDYEAANGVAAKYRARATITAGGVITSAWVESSNTTWSSTDYWLKNVFTPAESVKVCPGNLSPLARPRPQGVFYPLGRTDPIGVSDTRKSRTGTIEVVTLTDAAALALDTLLDTSVLLFQSPLTDRWGSRYILIGGTAEARPAAQDGDEQARRWQFPFVEVTRPAV